MTSIWWRTLVLMAALTVAGESEALACSCYVSGPPCQATWTADVIFTGTVKSMTTIDNDRLGAPYESKLVTIDADRGFVQAAPGPIEVVTGTGGGDCGYPFKVGQQYLLYASKTPSGRLSASICSRTRPIADAQEDLRYLTTMGKSGSGVRVYGRINELKQDPAEAETVDYGPVEGLTVSIRGATFARDVLTNADGRFEFPNLPVGKASLTIILPFGYQPSPIESDLELKDTRACRELDLSIRQVARASGRVVDSAGRPLAGVDVEAVAAELAGFDPPSYHYPAKTDERGAFEFDYLPPGSYVFGVNLTKSLYGRPRGKSVFLPGTAVAKEATVIELKPGDTKEVGTLRMIDSGAHSPQ
jgi:hypothetical protein